MENGINWYWKSERPELTVMMLTIPGRELLLDSLLKNLDNQWSTHVEILINRDEKTKTIGRKRQECLDAAKGRYVACLDDDDNVSGDYIESILSATYRNSDVICFDQEATISHGNPFRVSFSIYNPFNEQLKLIGGNYQPIKRKPFHMCFWRSEIAKRHAFQDVSFGEDWKWCESMLKEVHTETRIEKILHYYFYRTGVSTS